MKYEYKRFLYQSPQAILRKKSQELLHVRLARALTHATILAINTFFIDFISENFDPHVGDNLCQLRAVMLFEIHKNKSSLGCVQLLNSLKENLKKQALAEKNILYGSGILKNKMQLINFLEEWRLNFQMPEEVYCVILCYLLTRYRNYNKNPYSRRAEPNQLAYEFDISITMANALIKHWQVELRWLSASFVRKRDRGLSIFFDNLIEVSYFKQVSLPAFYIALFFVRYVIQNKVPVRYSHARDFILASDELEGEVSMMFVLSSVSSPEALSGFITKRAFLLELLLMSSANHPQCGIHPACFLSYLASLEKEQFSYEGVICLRAVHLYYFVKAELMSCRKEVPHWL